MIYVFLIACEIVDVYKQICYYCNDGNIPLYGAVTKSAAEK